jgi:hypothetical protein
MFEPLKRAPSIIFKYFSSISEILIAQFFKSEYLGFVLILNMILNGYRASNNQKGAKGRYQLTVGDKAWAKLRQSLKEVTCKTAPRNFAERIRKINEIQRGWLNYFGGQAFKESYEILMAVCAIACATAFGRSGRNPNAKGKT